MLDFITKPLWLMWTIASTAFIMAFLLVGYSTGVLTTPTAMITVGIALTILAVVIPRRPWRRFTPTNRIFSIIDDATPAGAVIYWRNPQRANENMYSHRKQPDYIHLWTAVPTPETLTHDSELTFLNEHFYFAIKTDAVIRLTGRQDCSVPPGAGYDEVFAHTFDEPDIGDDFSNVLNIVPGNERLKPLLAYLNGATPETIGLTD